MTCNVTSFLTVFESYEGDWWKIMKGCAQWNLYTIEKPASSKSRQ